MVFGLNLCYIKNLQTQRLRPCEPNKHLQWFWVKVEVYMNGPRGWGASRDCISFFSGFFPFFTWELCDTVLFQSYSIYIFLAYSKIILKNMYLKNPNLHIFFALPVTLTFYTFFPLSILFFNHFFLISLRTLMFKILYK